MLVHRRANLTIAFGFVLTAGGAVGQGAQHAPERPDLPRDADRNDQWSYYRLGQDQLKRNPEKAAAAFYWAARLNPTWAEAFYARRVALLLTNPRRLVRYIRGDKEAIREADAIDSLYLHALALNPFLNPHLDYMIVDAAVTQFSTDMANQRLNSPRDIFFEMSRFRGTSTYELRALDAYREGRYDDALSLYAKAISQSRDKAPLMAERGRLFYQIGQHDSALTELTRALEEMRKQDKNDLVFFYESKALMEERIGFIHRVKGNLDAAREAFGRAVEEDLSYYPAHIQLAYLALEKNDSTAVTNEMELAVQIKPDDAGIRFAYGYSLGSLGHFKDAELQLRKALELDPDFATPHFVLGDVLQSTGRRAEALKEFETFLARAARFDQRREDASQQIALLRGSQQ